MVTGSIGDIFVRLGLDPSGLSSGFTQAEKTLESLGNRMFFMGARLSAGITAPILAAGTAITKWGLEFDKAMTESLAIMNGVTPRLREQMEATARTVSETTKFGASEAAEAYYDLASAGLTAVESMESLDTVAKFAMAGVMDLGKAGEYLAGSVAAVGNASLGVQDKIQGMAKMADLLTQANNFALGTVEDFSKAISNKAGQAMRMYNITVEEGLSVLMAYAEQNIKAQAAGQQFWMVMRDLQRAVVSNADAFKQLGIEVYDSAGALNNPVQIVRQLETAFAGLTDQQRNSALASLGLQDRSKAATLALIGMSSEIERFQVALGQAGGVMDTVAKKQMEALSNQLRSLWNQFKNVATDIFTQFVPVIKEYLIPIFQMAIEKLKEFRDWLKTLSTEQKAGILAMVGFVAAIGPVIGALGTFILLARSALAPLGLLIRIITTLAGGGGFGSVVKVILGMNTAMKGSSAASQAMIAGMSAAGRAAAGATAETGGFIRAAGAVAGTAGTWATLSRTIGLVAKGLGLVGLAITGVTVALDIKDAVGGWSRFYDLINALTFGGLNEFVKINRDLLSLLTRIAETGWDWVTSAYDTVVGLVAGPLDKLLNKLADIGGQLRKNSDDSLSWFAILEATLFSPKLPKLPANPLTGMPGGQAMTPDQGEALIDPLTGRIPFFQPPSIEPRGTGFVPSEVDEEAKRAAQKMKELMEELSGATAIKAAQDLMKVMAKLPPVQNLTKEAQKKINETLFEAMQAYTALGQKAPEAMRALYEATFKNVKLPEMLADHAREMQDELQDVIQKNIKLGEAAAEVNQRLFEDGVKAAGELFDEYDRRFMSARDKQLKDAATWMRDQLKIIEPLKDKLPLVWEAARDNIVEIYGQMTMDTEQAARQQYEIITKSTSSTIADINEAWDNWFEEWYRKNNQGWIQFGSIIQRVSDSFRQLSRVASGTFKDIVDGCYLVLEAMEQVNKAQKEFERGQAAMKDGKMLEGIMSITGALIQMGAAFWEATGAGNTFQRTVGGALTGMQIGAALGGPIGAAIGAIAGGLTGLFRGLFGVSEAEKKGRETAAAFRQGLLDGLSKAQLKEVNEAMKHGWEGNKIGAATVIAVRDAYLKLGKTEQEALDAVNRLWAAEKKGPEAAKKVIEEIQAVIDRVAERHANAEIFVTDLGNAFQYVNDKGRLANKTMLEALRITQEMGAASETTNAIMLAGMDRTVTGMQTFLENADTWSHRTITTLAETLVVSVQAMQDAGMSLTDIIEKIKPVIESLKDKMRSAGLEGTEAFDMISRMADYMANETSQRAIAAISGLNDVLIGLHNTGLLNQERFGTLSAQITETFEKLIGEGFDSNTVIRLIAPSLQTIWELMQDFGYQVDSATQSLIDQGLEAGVIGEQMRDDNEKLKDIMEELVSVMQDFVDEMRIARGAAIDLGEAAGNIEFPPMPDYSFPEYQMPAGFMDPNRYSGVPIVDENGNVVYTPGDTNLPNGWPGDIRFAEGAYVTGPTPAWVGEGRYNEFVAPEPMLTKVVGEAVEDADGGGDVNVEVTINTYSSAGFEEMIDNKLVPAVITAFRRNRRGSKSELKGL